MGRAAVLELVVATWSIMGGHILPAGGAGQCRDELVEICSYP